MNHGDAYVYCVVTPCSDHLEVRLQVVSLHRKNAIEEFAFWCYHSFTCKDKERDYGLRWVRTYVDKNATNSCQWAVAVGKHGARFVLETYYNIRLIQGNSIGGQKTCWRDSRLERYFDVIVRSWTSPGSVGQKGLGMAYELLLMGKEIEIVNIAFQDKECISRLNLYSSKHQSQQNVLDLFQTYGIRFVSIRYYLMKLGYHAEDNTKQLIHL